MRLLALNKVDPSQLRSKKSKLKYELNLEQVFKPHTKSVTVITIDDQGEILATGVSYLCPCGDLGTLLKFRDQCTH